MTFIVATNVIAIRPPERRSTGTPTTRANYRFQLYFSKVVFFDAPESKDRQIISLRRLWRQPQKENNLKNEEDNW